jgi:hypothetical protein
MAHECPLEGVPSFGFSRCYWHLKERERDGGHLTQDELVFIGMTERSSANGHGWRSANGLASVDLESILGEEETALMQALIRIGTDANADFLG